MMEIKNIGLCVLFYTMFMPVVNTQAWAIDSDILCPTPEEIASIAPADLAQVQNDIDRYSLCVQRAQLLQQMDKLIKERLQDKDDNKSLQGLPEIEPLSATQSVDELKKMLQELSGEKLPKAMPLDAKPEIPEWYIKKMWGKSGKIYAQLAKESGLLTTVTKGDILSDGWEVSAISLTGVTIEKNGILKQLDWLEVKSNEDTVK